MISSLFRISKSFFPQVTKGVHFSNGFLKIIVSNPLTNHSSCAVIISKKHYKSAVQRILAMGAESVILSLGGRGAIAGKGDQVVEVVPPRIEAVSPIGAGDALNAAFVWAQLNGYDFLQSVRWGVAAGTASAKLPGMRFANRQQTEQIYDQVEIR